MRPTSSRRIQNVGDKGSRVQVGVRIRPLNRSDGQDDRVVIHSDGAGSRTVTVDDVAGRRSRSFEYDFVFEGQQQSDVYDAIGAPMLEEAYKGFNVCLFAYGQTGSGKTFSIQGEQESEDKQGIIPRFVRSMFREAQRRVEEDSTTTIKITMSMIEIYMEKVRDLLIPRVRGQEPESLDVQEDQNHKIVVRNVGVHSVLSADRVAELLAFGNANRQTAETKMNEMSSRSHSIVQFTILQLSEAVDRRDIESVVSLVDLAGSERQGKTETTGLQFEESKKINHSLLMLGRALNSFSEGKTDAFISLRESKLTRLLSESFGGNSKTWMLATISPSQFNATESISTLEYAQNALSITNKAEVNRLTKSLEMTQLKTVVEKLQSSIDEATNEVEDLEMELSAYTKRIAELSEQLERESGGKCLDDRYGKALAENDRLRKEIQALLETEDPAEEELFIVSPLDARVSVSLADLFESPNGVLSLSIPIPCDFESQPPHLRVQVSVQESPLNAFITLHIRVLEIVNMPRYATGGSQVTMWFRGQQGSATSTPVAPDNNGNPQFSFHQKFLFGPRTETLNKFFASDSLQFQILGFL